MLHARFPYLEIMAEGYYICLRNQKGRDHAINKPRCSAGCWIIASYDEAGALVKVKPDEGSPMGIICPLGEHSPDIVYSDHRLRHPLRRKGEKVT
jgi:anaerobic selenocysteine-containing dehydrogenase